MDSATKGGLFILPPRTLRLAHREQRGRALRGTAPALSSLPRPRGRRPTEASPWCSVRAHRRATAFGTVQPFVGFVPLSRCNAVWSTGTQEARDPTGLANMAGGGASLFLSNLPLREILKLSFQAHLGGSPFHAEGLPGGNALQRPLSLRAQLPR